MAAAVVLLWLILLELNTNAPATAQTDTMESTEWLALVETEVSWAALPWELWFSWLPFPPAPQSVNGSRVACQLLAGSSLWACDLHRFWYVRRISEDCVAGDGCRLSVALGVPWFNSALAVAHFALFSIAFATSVCPLMTLLSLWRKNTKRRSTLLWPIGHVSASFALIYFNMYAAYSGLSRHFLVATLALSAHALVVRSSLLFFSLLFDELLPDILQRERFNKTLPST